MTLRIVEGFDWLPVSTDKVAITEQLAASQYYLSSNTADWKVSDQSAFDYGHSLQISYTKDLFASLSQIVYPVPARDEGWMGYRCYVGASHSGFFGIAFMDSTDGATQVSIRTGPFGTVSVYRGVGGATTPIATSDAGVFFTEEWFFLEARIKVANTGGSVEVRINTKTVIDLADGDTQSGTRALFNLVGFQGSSAGGNWVENVKVDDWYYCDGDGSVNNGFLGNVRVKTQSLIAAGSHTGLTVGGTQTKSTLGLESDRSGSSFNLNTYNVALRRVKAKFTTTITDLMLMAANGNSTGVGKAVIYSDVSGEPGSLLATGTATTGWVFQITRDFPISCAVTAGTYYWIGVVTNQALPPYRTASDITTGRIAVTNFTTPGALTLTAPYYESAVWAITARDMENWEAVQNFDMAETAYVYSPTTGDYDLYDVNPIINAPFVHGIQARLGLRQDDATQRTARAVVQVGSGGTPSNGQDFYLNQSFSLYRDIFELNPDTGVFYTGTEANDVQIGPKVSG